MSTASHSPRGPDNTSIRLFTLATLAHDLIANLVAGIRKWLAVRQGRGTAVDLLEFDDAMLRDIGLTRSDIYVSLRHRDEDPTVILGRVSRISRRLRQSKSG